MEAGLYIHIPFCVKKCNYCDFYSVSYDNELESRYITAVIDEFNYVIAKNPCLEFDTVYIGGGTPSLLSEKGLSRLITGLGIGKNMKPLEFTIEANPEKADINFELYNELGINRLSLGIQTLNDDLLSYAGRTHDKAQALATLERANKYFDNISADIMLGFLGQDEKSVKDSLVIILPLVKHVSMYMLKLSENVAMYKDRERLEDSDRLADLYWQGYKILKGYGFERYEISNFSLGEQYVSRHNMRYWQRLPYVGLGAAAHSFLNGYRYSNVDNVMDYISLKPEKREYFDIQHISSSEALFEEIMLSLRLEKGLDLKRINKQYGINFLEKYALQIKKLKDFLDITSSCLKIKPEMLLLENQIVSEFMN